MDTIKKIINNRTTIINNIINNISKLIIGISAITSFASGIFKIDFLSFISGSLGIMSLILMQLNSFNNGNNNIETNKSIEEMNNFLKNAKKIDK